MEEKQNIINRVYALRAGISLLAMQYDSYYNSIYETQKLYLEISEKFKNIMEENLNKTKSKFFGHIFDFPRLGTSVRLGACKNNSVLDGHIYYRHNGYCDADKPEYWLNVMGQVCFFNLTDYQHDQTSVLSYYEKLADFANQFQCNIDEEGYIFLCYDFNNWKNSFNDSSDQLRIARDFIVKITTLDMKRQDKEFRDDLECWNLSARDWLKRFMGGQWLFTEEARAHYKTKLKELNMVVDRIRSDTENLRPKGLTKIFNKYKNHYEITQNEKSIELGMIAIKNMEKAIDFLDNEIPKTKALIEQNCTIQTAKTVYPQILSVLQEEFCNTLDRRDWAYVDLVIYYLESGRADTMKEALLLLDNERRANRIVGAIQEASRSICTTLNTGFKMLNSTLQQGFAAIETRIVEQNKLLAQQNELMAQQKNLLIQQNAKVAELVSANNMRNALLAKQNESSEQLVNKMTNLERAITA